MAWNEHYRIQFKSLNNTLHTISIYEQGYTGSVVSLTGGEKPIITQEDDSSDIFTASRMQTGSINIVMNPAVNPDDADILADLRPASYCDKFVRMTANGTTEWQGFLSPDMYTQPWDGSAHEVSIPIHGMYAALGYTIIPTDTANGGLITLGGVIVAGLTQLAGSAEDAEWMVPSFTFIDDMWGAYHWLKYKVNWNAFFYYDTEDEELYTVNQPYGQSYMTAIERICSLWGVTARENGATLVFAMYEGTVVMNHVSWADLVAISTSGTPAYTDLDLGDPLVLPDDASWKGDDNTMGYDGGAKKVSITFDPGDSVKELCYIPSPVAQSDEAVISVPNLALKQKVYVQNYPIRTATNETFSFYVWDDDTNGYIPSSMSNVINNSVLYGVHGQGYTGAWPVRWANRVEAKDFAEMKPGIFLNQGRVVGTTAYMMLAYTIKSGRSVTLPQGYLYINMKNRNFFRPNNMQSWVRFDARDTLHPDNPVYCVLYLGVRVGDKIWKGGALNLNNIIGHNDWETYGVGEWVDYQGNADALTPIVFVDSDLHSNKIDAMNVQEEEGFLIPITSTMEGEVSIVIYNRSYFYITSGSGGTGDEDSFCRILSDITIAASHENDYFADGTKTNNYIRHINNGFDGEVSKDLDFGTFNANLWGPNFLLDYSDAYFFKQRYLPYSAGDTGERPEVHLVERMKEYYSQVRREMKGTINGDAEIMTKIWQYSDRLYIGCDSKHDWADDKKTVKFIEINSAS